MFKAEVFGVMVTITFLPADVRVTVPKGTDLLEAARLAGIEIVAPCGGKGSCGKCIVRITDGDIDTESLGLLSRAAVADGYVLACKTWATKTDVVVTVPEAIGRTGGQFADSADDTELIRAELFPQNWHYDPLAVKWLLQVPPPQADGGLSDVDRLTNTIQRQWGHVNVIMPLPVIRKVADALRERNGEVTATLIREDSRIYLVNLEPGDTTTRHYGVAVDLGTTTISVRLVYLPLAESVGTRSDYNDQISCGLDVISRINFAHRPGGLKELRKRVLGTINRLVRTVSESHGVSPREISNAVISGNTVMVHLLLGLNPEYIRLEPYVPTVMETPFLSAADVGLDIDPLSWVGFSPSVGSYVGGDITAGLLCTELATDTEEVSLFIDIGTNGEVVVGNSEFLLTCACSAGPAFEGGGIECGMRAAVGAIERVEIDASTGRANYWTIGDVKPGGICGSGMISLLANLFLTGWLDAAGKLNRDKPCEFIQAEGRHATYTIVPAAEAAGGKPVVISELDIDNIIRAKAAIYSACALLLNQVGIDFTELSAVYIAGGFGRYLDLEKAKVIGLIPDLPREKFRYIGNSSLVGSYIVLVSREFRERQMEIARRMTYLDLSTDPAYMDQYTGALFLPHTDPNRFPTVMVNTGR